MGEFFSYKHTSQFNHDVCFGSKVFLFLFISIIQLVSLTTKVLYFNMAGGILFFLGYWLLVIFSTGLFLFAKFAVLFLIVNKCRDLLLGIVVSMLTAAVISFLFLYLST
jgi:hypothetical protein